MAGISRTQSRSIAHEHRKPLQTHAFRAIYDIFEGTAEIQQLVISRAISGMHIK